MKPKKGNFSAHSSNISTWTQKTIFLTNNWIRNSLNLHLCVSTLLRPTVHVPRACELKLNVDLLSRGLVVYPANVINNDCESKDVQEVCHCLPSWKTIRVWSPQLLLKLLPREHHLYGEYVFSIWCTLFWTTAVSPSCPFKYCACFNPLSPCSFQTCTGQWLARHSSLNTWSLKCCPAWRGHHQHVWRRHRLHLLWIALPCFWGALSSESERALGWEVPQDWLPTGYHQQGSN